MLAPHPLQFLKRDRLPSVGTLQHPNRLVVIAAVSVRLALVHQFDHPSLVLCHHGPELDIDRLAEPGHFHVLFSHARLSQDLLQQLLASREPLIDAGHQPVFVHPFDRRLLDQFFESLVLRMDLKAGPGSFRWRRRPGNQQQEYAGPQKPARHTDSFVIGTTSVVWQLYTRKSEIETGN